MVAAVSFGKKNDAEGIVRLCDYMLILHFEDKCAAELITAEPISDRGEGRGGKKNRLLLLWHCKHSVNLRAYWLLSNYARTQRTA